MNTGLRHTLAQLGWLNAALYWLGRSLDRASAGRWSLHRYRFVAQYVGDQPLCAGRGADIEIAPHTRDQPVPAEQAAEPSDRRRIPSSSMVAATERSSK